VIEANEIEYWASLGNVAKVLQGIQSGHDINLKGVGGYTAVHAAAENNHVEVLQLLLENGADVSPQLESGETPLDLARLAGHDQVVSLLQGKRAI
jgi:uncharacterized protein